PRTVSSRAVICSDRCSWSKHDLGSCPGNLWEPAPCVPDARVCARLGSAQAKASRAARLRRRTFPGCMWLLNSIGVTFVEYKRLGIRLARQMTSQERSGWTVFPVHPEVASLPQQGCGYSGPSTAN